MMRLPSGGRLDVWLMWNMTADINIDVPNPIFWAILLDGKKKLRQETMQKIIGGSKVLMVVDVGALLMFISNTSLEYVSPKVYSFSVVS
jgi:hypothetical protein